MFPDYDDSYHDIDYDYSEVHSVFPDPPQPPKLPVEPKAEQATASTKQPFYNNEYRPNEIVDGRSIGEQPKYNLLYSAPKENYMSRMMPRGDALMCQYQQLQTIHIIIFFVLLLVIVYLHTKLSNMEYALKLLLATHHTNVARV